jgi:hypothetical protein
MVIPLSVILENASKQRTRAERIAYLRANQTTPLMILLQYCFHPAVKWLLPVGQVPYTPLLQAEDQESHLYHEARKMYYFIEGGYPGNITNLRRQQMFIEMLEGIDPRDAILLCAIKDKVMPFEGIDADLVREAFPGVLPVK